MTNSTDSGKGGHTPGPWEIDQDACFMEPGFYGGERGYHSITIPGVTDMTGFCGDSNARLITAAPELFEALKEYDEAFTELDPDSKQSRNRMRRAVVKARAALARATGERE